MSDSGPAMATDTDDQSVPSLLLGERAAKRLRLSVIAFAVVMVLYAGALIRFVPDYLVRMPGLLTALIVCLAVALPLWRGQGHLALVRLSYGVLIYVAVAMMFGGGLRAPILVALPLLIVIPGWLLGRRMAVRQAGLVVLVVVALTLADWQGLLPHPPSLPIGFVLAQLLIAIGLALQLTLFANNTHRQRFRQVQKLNRALASAQKIAADNAREFKTLADNLPAQIVRVDNDLRCVYANRAYFAANPTRTLEGIIGQPVERIMDHMQKAVLMPALKTALAGECPELIVPHSESGRNVLYEMRLVRETDSDGRVTGLLGMFHDVTERERMQSELRHMAMHDALTRLANRQRIDDHLETALLRAERSHEQVALIAIDLDGFKPINDTYGHAAGDHLLCHVARQMEAAVRSADMVGRVGGDEFVVVSEGIKDELAVQAVAMKLLRAIQQPTDYQGNLLSVGASIGIALWPTQGKTVRDLYQGADEAMYAAKAAGKNCFRLAAGQICSTDVSPSHSD